VDDDVIPFREDQAVLVTEAVRSAAGEIEQPFATRFNMGAVLDVFIRSEAGGRLIVALVEQRVEGVKHAGFVLLRTGICSELYNPAIAANQTSLAIAES
jgi:hypothetical protein